MSDLNKQLHDTVSAFASDISDLLMSGDEICTDTLNVSAHVLAVLLPIAAAHGSINNHKDYDIERRMVYMGNKSVVNAIEAIHKSGSIDELLKFEELINSFLKK